MQSTVNAESSAVHFNQRAEIYLSQGKVEEAIAACEQALKVKPDFAQALKTLGNALQAQGRVEEARHWYAKAIQIQPNFAEAYANLGSIYAAEQKWSEAITHYQKAIALKPNFAGVYRNLAKVLAQLGKDAQSQDCWYQAFTLEPEKATAEEHLNLGNSLLQQQKLQEAVNCYSRAIKLNPNLAQAYQNLGDALKQAGNLEQAAPYYRKAIELKATNGKTASGGVDTLPSASQGVDTLPSASQGVDTLPSASRGVDTLPSASQGMDTLPSASRANGNVKQRPAAPAVGISTEDPEAYNILAEGYLAQGKFPQAIAACRRSLQLKPDAAIYKLLGNALQAMGKVEDAKNCYLKALEINPNFAEAYANLGSLYGGQQQWQSAIAAFQKAIAIKPDFAGAYRNFAKLWTQVGKPQEAAECWYRGFNLDPSKATADEYINLAKTFLEQGKLDQGIDCYRRGLELNPSSSWGYHELAEILKNQEKWEESISFYSRAIELNPDHSWSHNNLADALIKLERWEEAVPAYLSAIKLNPDHSWSHNNLGDALVKLERWEEAAEAYAGANQVKNDFFWSQNNLGDALLKLERWEEAADAYRRAIELNADHCGSHTNLAEALVKLEDWEGAIAAYRRAIELNPDFFWSHNNLGDALIELERWEESVPVYRRALELNPDFAWAHYNLGQALEHQEEWDEAIASYRRAAEIQPDLPWLPQKLADAIRQRAQWDLEAASKLYREAIEYNPDDVQLYHKALEIAPNDADLYVGLADALVRQGWLDGAIVFYQMALQIQPSDRRISARLEEVLGKKKGVSRAVLGENKTPSLLEKDLIENNAGAASDYQKLGETLQGEGKINEAIAAYKKAIEINPNYFGTYHNLGDLLKAKGKIDEAINSYRKSAKLNPSFVWSYHNLGDLFQQEGRLDEAAAEYHKALEVDPNFGWSYFNLARTLAKQDRFSEALKAYETANKLDPKLFGLDYQNLRDAIFLGSDPAYSKWRAKNCPREADLRKMAETVEIFSYKPLISIVMPVFNTPENYLREAIDSVINQIYPYWELCIADDASTDVRSQQILREYAAKDPRIKVVFRTENGHISRCSNSALEVATGEFISLLDHDDTLTPEALYEVVLLLNRHPEADMIYSDEDKILQDKELINPYFKQEWCPDSFLSRMYTCHLGTYRRSILNEIGGFRVGFEGAQDYDMVLRFTEKTDKIFHIPKVLYHWRMHAGSAAGGTDAKPYAYQSCMKALQNAIDRRGEPGRVEEVPNFLGHYIIRYKITDYKRVSIIIPTRDLGDVLDNCLESIFTKSAYPNYEVIVIDNGSKEKKTAEIFAKWTAKEPERFRCYPLDIPFNFSKLNNYAVSKARGDYLLFLNNDTEAIDSEWIGAMVEQAQRPTIGAVGGLLIYADNTIQHAGVVMGLGGVAGHSYYQMPKTIPGYFGNVVGMNNVSAVTGACLMCRREVFESVGGFDEELTVGYNDVDLCLKMLEKGYRNIYLPHVVLYHHESKSRGYEDTPEKKERLTRESKIIESRWSKFIENDPCYSPHLTRVCQDSGIRVEA